METLLSWRKKGLSSPLTMACRKNNDIWSESVAAFGMVLKYMGTKTARESGIQLLKKLQKRLVENGPDFKDEVLCQVHHTVY